MALTVISAAFRHFHSDLWYYTGPSPYVVKILYLGTWRFEFPCALSLPVLDPNYQVIFDSDELTRKFYLILACWLCSKRSGWKRIRVICGLKKRWVLVQRSSPYWLLHQAFFLYTLEKTQGPKKTQGSRKNSGFCQFSSKLRSKTAIFGWLYLIRLQKNSGSGQKNSGFWISCWSIDIHQGVKKKAWL